MAPARERKYLAIDVGGSKTLLAVFSTSGDVVKRYKIPTNPVYRKFLKDLEVEFKKLLGDHDILFCCCAVPGRIERKRGLAVTLGNLNWHNAPIAKDIKALIKGAPVLVENDANLGGLSEASLIPSRYKKVLYLTVGTGIGAGFITNGKISADFADSEVGHMVLQHEGQLAKWETFASGRALRQKYGKKASEINDPAIWSEYAKNLALGLDTLIALLQPDIVIIGGGIGAHFDKFGSKLAAALKEFENNMVKIPPIVKAKRPEEAVIYGCYQLIRSAS